MLRARASTVRTEHLPRVAQPGLWTSMIPKFMRPSPVRAESWRTWMAKDWNPATIFIALGLLVGSNAINMLILRKDIADFSRKADAKIALLREVVEKIQAGEKVDVERILGSGKEKEEGEWEEMLKEIEEEDRTSRKRRKAVAEAKETAEITKAKSIAGTVEPTKPEPTVVPEEKRTAIGFY
ncbi:uncharacterized protein K452DRAFT_227835 [Aplosporella prunicola CBS 121167]|uniref:Uncharacterized protein n=1 Tax=Aplosporella prunicola CBS 121167 TaxID=1176127 RepID=A0A6A6BC77_9PEZI|nr:uncharacterized protein K452DRAFT_227835 [Aplosporella prunicola CBS 121167]KAF2141646.1 hypothetical protein K452DRAFT_227835 [Aplosporella prunicola CBS 121167]